MNFTDDGFTPSDSTTSVYSRNDVALFPEYQAAMFLWKVYPPCILLLGGFGNIATIFVMRRIKDHNSSQHIVLMSLAVSDFFFLNISALFKWLLFLFRVDLYNSHEVVCKLYAWMIYSSTTSSAWLLTCVTVQRTMAVKWPHKVRVMCSTRRTWIAVAAVVLSAFCIQFHWLVGMEFSSTTDGGGACTYVSAEYLQFVLMWNWVDMCLSSLLPSTCLLLCDVMLSLTLFKASSSTSMTVQAISNSSVANNNDNNNGSISNNINKSRRKTASRTTVMILALSCTFLLLTLPVCAYIIWTDIVDVTQNSALYARAQLVKAVTFLLWYTNSAVNFLLYCLTGTKFRREFLSWVSCGAKSTSGVYAGGKKPPA
ncbi:cysteinyl leukotriene receptor 2-like [Babylonia areolata]|uniref:cysteinyl leukotriene receptor 2-like n=1 Tax=Babylonia areolata TaxID=304850 RepID=UPI003FCF0078